MHRAPNHALLAASLFALSVAAFDDHTLLTHVEFAIAWSPVRREKSFAIATFFSRENNSGKVLLQE